MFIFNLFTFVAGFQFDLSAVAPVAPVGSSPDPEHIGGPRLKPVHRHHVWAGLQDRVVLLPLILKRRTEQQERIKNWYYRYDLKGNIKSNTGKNWNLEWLILKVSRGHDQYTSLSFHLFIAGPFARIYTWASVNSQILSSLHLGAICGYSSLASLRSLTSL